MVGISKWLVGSSSNQTSGSVTNDLAIATRFNQPPERLMSFSSGGSFMRWSTDSTRWCSTQPSMASIWVCNCAIRSKVVSSKVPIDTWAYSASSSPASLNAEATAAKIVVSSPAGRSCSSVEKLKAFSRHMFPSSASTSPHNSRIKVLLPLPLRPVRHTRSPLAILNST